ncbi:META domain-containing protein [Streptomyces canus]|uniref:META domain-containing protein n=1 Tax=Streptomyces canus TaxID=58343 RepID=UPI002E3205E4|nr:META domain-containing protein [Streptomyces canus]
MKRTTHAKYAAAALAGTTVLAACGTETVGAGTEDVSTIADTSWVPRKVTVDGKDYVLPEKGARRHAHIEFDPGTAEPDVGGGKSGGSVGCNSIGADVDIEGDTVKVSDLVRTLIGCGGALGTFEEKFVGVFDNDLEAELKGRSGARTLTLTSPQNDTITLREEQAPALKGTRWSLGEIAYLTLTRNNTVTGSFGCNTFNGRAVVKDGTIEFGRLATTRMMCEGPVMKAERELAEILSGKVSYQQKQDSLKITDASGRSVTAHVE